MTLFILPIHTPTCILVRISTSTTLADYLAQYKHEHHCRQSAYNSNIETFESKTATCSTIHFQKRKELEGMFVATTLLPYARPGVHHHLGLRPNPFFA